LFLDEIGNLSLKGQARLLRVLQSGEFERLGSSTTRKVDVRIVSATNSDLEKGIGSGQFREDLGLATAGAASSEEVGTLDHVERATIERALETAQGVISRAAAELGLSRQALYRRMERLGIVMRTVKA
jgi:transcriptional regulator with GAF, ATPase, and Fis domain